MSQYNQYVASILKICELEEKYEIFNENIKSIPVWSIVFRQLRGKYTEICTGVPPLSNHPKFNLKKCLSTTLKSLFQIIRLFFSKKSIDNIIYGFPRLEHINGVYVDKFCDELIKQTSLSESYCYMARSRSFVHPQPRSLSNIVWLEFIDNFSLLIGKAGMPLFFLLYKSTFNSLFSKANNIIKLTKADERFIIRTVGTEMVKFTLTKTLLKKLKTKRIFSPVLHGKPFLIATAKALDIPCFELQHGMTEGPTILYSGVYLPDFSPTAFLAFGNSSMRPVFNVPIEKMVNIGFPYKSFLSKQVRAQDKDHYLLVSAPDITQAMVNVACSLKDMYPECNFSIRFHPQEKATPDQIQQLINGKIFITDNKENSSLAILRYEGVIGEISTVLYEALNMKKKAAKIHFQNLNPDIVEENEKKKGFFIMNSPNDFKNFRTMRLDSNKVIELYSDFNIDEFNKILKLQHFQ